MCRTDTSASAAAKSNQRLAILLAMAMFVLVVDTSLMNVSISAVVRDIGTTVSGVQSAIALEALVSAAFILIGSKVGDLIGRKLAYVLGLLGYAVGALAMAFAQSLTAIIVFWAVVGGLGASLLLPAMQSLIHGTSKARRRRGPTPQILSNTQLEQQLASHPEKVQNEIIRINTDARHLALQIALLIPILAGALGLLNSFRMMRLPDPVPSETGERMALG